MAQIKANSKMAGDTLVSENKVQTLKNKAIEDFTLISGSGNIYCENFCADSTLLPIDNILYVAKNGNDSNTGSIGDPFLTISYANNYAVENIPVWPTRVIIKVAPGLYADEHLSQAHYRVHIVGNSRNLDHRERDVIIANLGTSSGTYPLGMNKGLNLDGITVATMDAIYDNYVPGVFGTIMNMSQFSNCTFRGGYFVEQEEVDAGGLNMNFQDCFFNGDAFKLAPVTRNFSRFIALRGCDISEGTTSFESNGTTSSGTVKFENTMLGNPLKIGGSFALNMQSSEIYKNGSLIFDTTGWIDIYSSIICSGIHFISDTPDYKKLTNNIFRETPNDQCDIIADVDILDVEYLNNHQDHGLCGEIKIKNTTKTIGCSLSDSYKNITEALKATDTDDLISLGSETYEINTIVPEGVAFLGIDKVSTILTSTSGTTLTLSGSLSNSFDNLSITSTPSGTVGDHALELLGGTHYFTNCEISSTPTETCTTALLVNNSTIELKDSKINYNSIGNTSGAGTHQLSYFEGTAGINLRDSTLKMTIADTNSLANASMFESTGTGTFIESYLIGNIIEFNATSAAWNGDCFGYKALGIGTNRNILTNTINLTGGGGTGDGYWYILDTPDNTGEIHSSSNRVKVTGFNNNYFGDIATGDTLISHFDDITASGVVIGDGTYEFVNSPDPGDLRISGAYINMHDNDLVVAKRGGEFTSLKDALDSITDNDRNNRYNIHIHSGFYEEENPIELKPYVYIDGEFKHNPRIIPKNPLEHLFTIASGYCTCDLGELTLQAPAGDSNHQVYMVYAGTGCKPIMGVYQCLFLGDNVDYCNGFYCEESLSGFHTVNCMAYGSFDTFARMSGGNWTDSGFIPEATTTMKYYLYMDGEGIALIDLMRAKCPDIEKMFYIDHANAELIVSDIYAEDQQTLTTGPNGGKIRMRGSTFHGKNTINAGDITIHGGTFENNANFESLTGNLEALTMTSTKNKNENEHCVKITGGVNTKVYLGGGNIFDSPNGIQPIKLNGTFAEVRVEGVRQYNLSTLASGGTYTFEHLPDLEYSRMVQVQAYPGVATSSGIEYLTAEETNYIQEDDTKTVFIGNTVTLSGIGSIAYAHWDMNETSGQIAHDISGNVRNGYGEHTDDTDWIGGKVNNCLQFDNKDERIECGNIASWERTDVFTLECWVYTTNTQLQYVLSKMENATGKGYGFYLDSTNRPHFILRNSTGNELDVYWNSALSTTTWYHVVCTYDGTSTPGGCHIWVNNDDKTLATLANTLSSSIINTAGFQMSGKEGRDNDELVGRIDEVVIYEQEITSTEIAYRYNGGTGTESLLGTHPTTKGYYVTTASGSQLDISTWTNIGGMVFDETIKASTQINYLLSTDNRDNWSYWSGSSWLAGTLSGIDTCGNSSTELENLDSNAFNGLFVVSSGTLDIAASLKTTDAHKAPILDNVNVNYSLAGTRDRVGSNSIKVTYTDTTHTKITNITEQPITGIKCNILKLLPY